MDAVRHYRDAAMVPAARRDSLPAQPLPDGVEMGIAGSTRLLVGHYGLDGMPQVQHPRLAVLDYGAGLKGPLIAYSWDGEAALSDDKLVAVGGGVHGS